MRRVVSLIVAALLMGAALWMHGQVTDPKAEIQQKLSSQFTLTIVAPNQMDIVTGGSILVLQKNGLLMCSVSNGDGGVSLPATSTYTNGQISQGPERSSAPAAGSAVPLTTEGRLQMRRGFVQPSGAYSNLPSRKFVAGEKFWVTKAYIGDDGVIFRLYSDPYNDVRYWGELRFPFPNGTVPPAGQLMSTIAEVLTVQPNDNAGENASQQTPKPAPEPALAPIAPPPPPADTPPPPPKTISLGQTRDEVMAIFGQPQKVVKLAAKEMLYYPDMKVTLVKGKVADVQ
jgi:hypothetical protein